MAIEKTRIEGFPSSRYSWRVVDIGPASRSDMHLRDPLWPIKLRQIIEEEADEEEENQESWRKVPATLFQFTPLGSLWRRGVLREVHGHWPSTTVRIDSDKQRVVWRRPHNSNVRIGQERAAKSIPYIEVPLVGDTHCDKLLIRCSEIIRFYFCVGTNLPQALFDFSNGTKQNPRLFDHRHTKFADGEFVIKPAKGLTNDIEAGFIGGSLGHPPSAAALAMISSTARADSMNKIPIRPVSTLPISGVNKWQVFATQRWVYEEEECERPGPYRALMTGSIKKCHAKIDFPKVRVFRGFQTTKPGTRTSNGVRSDSQGVGPNPTVTMENLGRSNANLLVDPFEAISSARPGLVRSRPTVVFQKDGKEPEHGMRVSKHRDKVDTVSALQGGAGSDLIGGLSINVDGPPPVVEYEGVEPYDDEPAERAHLPSLFEENGITQPTIVDTPLELIPDHFEPFFLIADYLMELDSVKDVDFLGQSISNDSDSVRLYSLPSNWGPSVKCKNNSSGHRRALVMNIVLDFFAVRLLNIERRHPGEIGPFFLMSAYPTGLPLQAIINALYCRIGPDGVGWPTRTSHSGDFVSHKSKHARNNKDVVTKTFERMENSLTILTQRANRRLRA